MSSFELGEIYLLKACKYLNCAISQFKVPEDER